MSAAADMTARAAPVVEIAVEDPRWGAALGDPAATAAEAAAIALDAAGLAAARFSVSALLTDDAGIAALNARFRGRARPTNVLSWPAFDLAPEKPGARPPPPPAAASPFGGPAELGDVALAFETVAAEAAARGLAVETHAVHLIVHAVLHLCGYDHETDADAAVMEGLERRALLAAGRPDPYAGEEGARERTERER